MLLTSLARCSVLLALLGLLTGCNISISGLTGVPPQMSSAQLRASGKGALIVSAHFVTATTTTICQGLSFTHAGSGRNILVTLSGLSPFTAEQPGDGVLVEPGTYVATMAYCPRGDTMYMVRAPDARGIARISIGAGEAVDGGTLIVTDDFKALITPYIGKSNFVALVRPRIEPLPASLNPELAAKVVRRPMTAIDPPPHEALMQICENQRQHAKTLWFGSGSGDPPLCRLIGPRPPNTMPKRQRPVGQPI